MTENGYVGNFLLPNGVMEGARSCNQAYLSTSISRAKT